MKLKKQETEIEKIKFEAQKNMLESILDRLDFIALMVDYDRAKEVLNKIKASKGEEDKETKDLLKFMDEMKEIIPETINVCIPSMSKESKFFLPKFKRKKNLGISINQNGGDDLNGNGTVP